jgi:hypothetical protein
MEPEITAVLPLCNVAVTVYEYPDSPALSDITNMYVGGAPLQN